MNSDQIDFILNILYAILLIVILYLLFIHKPKENFKSGNFTDTCDNIKYLNGKITASCKTKKGKKKDTEINYINCNKTINNCNGNLKCGKC